ncbi:hypothetical protein [Pseudarthrobacter sp. B4EP4b]|uniref:hypothetical protein n=1 Tax=Pseudarthrobacter sp. B4EP4b TaxID=2590664 RepID=UPI001C6681DF|nr:hypothetical protein [Pseudarthrobacter sp. B4EP4b]
MSARPSAKAPAFLFGMGMGGFVDGIVLHERLELNTLADGLFHGALWVLVAAAAVLTGRGNHPGQAQQGVMSDAGPAAVQQRAAVPRALSETLKRRRTRNSGSAGVSRQRQAAPQRLV